MGAAQFTSEPAQPLVDIVGWRFLTLFYGKSNPFHKLLNIPLVQLRDILIGNLT